jgi:crotonobetainyl-CoA:carnitine CoA-transferase CaiB-like acyl-CoA transferase
VNAFSGLADITGYEGGPPRLLGAVLPDTIGGMYITLALLVALYSRRRAGEGCYVDFSMLEGLLSVMPQPIIDYTLNGREPRRVGNRDAAKAPHGIYRCKGEDRWVAISVTSQDEWIALCNQADRRDWLADPRFADELARAAHGRELDAAVEAWTRQRTADEVTRLLQQAGIAAGAALDVAELLADPHLRAREFVVEVDHPEAGPRKTVGLPWKLGNVADCRYTHAPLLGEHNRYVFGELLGLSDDEIRDLISEKVIE